jgi:cyclopropane fatty-acyl-phospholipid synthase-like methyltransferase
MTYSVSEACERNKEPIRKILASAFAHSRKVLEIGSGTGQHAVHCAANLPHLSWQPSDTGDYLPGLRERIAHTGTPNLRPAIELDVRALPWQVEPVDAIFTANTLHIMAWDAVKDLFRGVGSVLTAPAVLCIYGPFRYGGEYTSASNAEFDRFLQARDPASGIRNFEDVNTLSSEQGLHLLADHLMPANNQLLIWQKPALPSQTTAPY